MINNPINATEGKHTFHLPLEDFYRNLSVEIWMENCANFNVCGVECVSICVGISLAAVVAGDIMRYMTWPRMVKSQNILQTWGAKIYSSSLQLWCHYSCERVSVFNIIQIDVNSIPPGSWGDSEFLGSTVLSACQKCTNNQTAKSAHQNLHIQTIILDPVYFYYSLL